MTDNVSHSAIYLGNFPDVDTISGGSPENPNDLLGVYGSATAPLFKDVLTITSDSIFPNLYTEDFDTVLNSVTYDVGAGPLAIKLDSILDYDATITFSDGTTTNAGVLIIQTEAGDVFLLNRDADAFWSAGKMVQSLSLDAYTSNRLSIAQDDINGTNFVACFAGGTLIETPQGAVPVEVLCRGMLVETPDAGPQPLLQVFVSRYTKQDLSENFRLRPVVIPAGTLGNGKPGRDLVLSRQHRVLIGTGEEETLVPAHALQELPNVSLGGPRDIVYYHLLLERHHLLSAEGTACESLLAAYGAIRGLEGKTDLSLNDRRLLSRHMAPVRPIEIGARARSAVRRYRAALTDRAPALIN